MSNNSAIEKSKRGLLRVIFSRTTLIALLLVLNFAFVLAFLFELIQGLPILFGSMVLFTAFMELYILNTRESTTMKLSWCIIIAVMPLFGTLLYVFIRLDLGNRLSRRLTCDCVRLSLPFVPAQEHLYETLKCEEPELYNLAYYLKHKANAPAYGNTAVEYFPLGEDKFNALLAQLEKAEHFIFMEYFLISHGHMWGSILDILERKAAQGVEVRVLYDGMNALYNLPYSYPKELAKKGIKAKMYSPIRPFVSTHYNNRDHRKIAVIDGKVAFTGGVNLEDCYINREVRYGHWKDTAVMLRGEAVRSFTLLFLQMWNAGEAKREFAPYLHSTPCPEAKGCVIPYGDNPADGEHVGEMVYLNIINQARDYLYIMTPYLILDSELSTALKCAAKRGVDVRLILPHIPDKKSAFALAKSHYPDLVGAGVKIYEYTPGFVHAKVFLCDDIHGVVGTINLDYRSLYHHFECAAYLYKVPALADIKADFIDTFAKSERITMDDVRRARLGMRLLGALLKIFAPLL